MRNIKDITGQRFGRLVALHLLPTHKTGARWLCQCDCGNTTEVRATAMRHGQIKSCGCLLRDLQHSTKPVDFAGRRFGKLVAQRAVQGPHGRSWECLCDCGKSALVRTGLLTSGNTRSCGCGQSVPRAA